MGHDVRQEFVRVETVEETALGKAVNADTIELFPSMENGPSPILTRVPCRFGDDTDMVVIRVSCALFLVRRLQ